MVLFRWLTSTLYTTIFLSSSSQTGLVSIECVSMIYPLCCWRGEKAWCFCTLSCLMTFEFAFDKIQMTNLLNWQGGPHIVGLDFSVWNIFVSIYMVINSIVHKSFSHFFLKLDVLKIIVGSKWFAFSFIHTMFGVQIDESFTYQCLNQKRLVGFDYNYRMLMLVMIGVIGICLALVISAIICSLVSSLLTMSGYSIVIAGTRFCLILKTGYIVRCDFSTDNRFNLIIDNVSVAVIAGLAYIVSKSTVVDVWYTYVSIMTKYRMDQQRNLGIHDWPKMGCSSILFMKCLFFSQQGQDEFHWSQSFPGVAYMLESVGWYLIDLTCYAWQQCDPVHGAKLVLNS